MCFIVPCAQQWHSCFPTGMCAFEDATVRVIADGHLDNRNTGAITKVVAFQYGPDLRAGEIRESIRNEALRIGGRADIQA